MPTDQRILEQVLSGGADSAIEFSDLLRLLAALGFDVRIRGDHFIHSRPGIRELLNLQPDGHLAKRYQVKQVQSVIIANRLELRR